MKLWQVEKLIAKNEMLLEQVKQNEIKIKTELKARVESGCTIEGKYKVVERSRFRRLIDAAKFRAMWPETYVRLATIPVMAAEKAIGSENLLAVVSVKESKWLTIEKSEEAFQ